MKSSDDAPLSQHSDKNPKSKSPVVIQEVERAIEASDSSPETDDARLLQKAAELVKKSPDARKEKVAQLKKSVASGTYKVDAQALAEKIVDEHVKTHFGKNSI